MLFCLWDYGNMPHSNSLLHWSVTVNLEFLSESLIFVKRSFVKIKPSRIGDITPLFTDIGKPCPVCDFLRHKCVF